MNKIHRFSSLIKTPSFNLRQLSSKPTTKNGGGGGGDDEWNDAWETAWLPDDLSPKHRAPWEADVNFSISNTDNQVAPPSDLDPDTKAFVEDMNDNWDHRRGKKAAAKPHQETQLQQKDSISSSGKNSLYSLERVKKDYRLKKQRVHAGLWMKEIEKMEESKLADSVLGGGGADDIERFLDSASEYDFTLSVTY